MSEDEREKMKAWVANWKQTGEELDRIKWDELRTMDERTAVQQSTQALAMADSWMKSQTTSPDRSSGMIEQQYWFAKWAKELI